MSSSFNLDEGFAEGGGGVGGGGGGGGGDGGYGGAVSTTALYVGNLPWTVDDAALYQIFTDSGLVPTSTNVTIGRDGRSRGFGICEFSTTEDAQAGIDTMNGFELGGRPLTVRFDAPRDSRPARAPRAGGFGVSSGCSIFVRNIPMDMTWEGLKDLFGDLAPEFADVKVGADGISRGWGTVRFADSGSANAAIEQFNGYEVPGGEGALEVRLDNKA